MAQVLVIYDSMYGNTGMIAKAMADALAEGASVETMRIGDVSPQALGSADLVIVGSPTQGFRPTKPVMDWLKRVGASGLRGTRVAAFDTRIVLSKIKSGGLRWMINAGGYAAPRIARDLTKAGGTLVLSPEGFFVEDTEGPLKAGELERAAGWARSVMHAG